MNIFTQLEEKYKGHRKAALLFKQAFLFYKEILNTIKYRDPYFFKWIAIETHNQCNRSCSYCPYSILPPRHEKKMESSTIYKITEDLKALNWTGWICFTLYNEPLLDVRLSDIIFYMRRKLPKVKLHIFTNGDLLYLDKAKDLIESGIDRIIVTLHEPIYRETENRILSLLEIFPKHIVMEYRNKNSYNWNRGGLLKVSNPVKLQNCYDSITMLNITTEGDVILCCNDYHRQNVFGNVHDDYLYTIWENKEFKKLRQDLVKGKRTLPICKQCLG